MSDPYQGQSSTQDVPGVSGTNTAGGTGVRGQSDDGRGVEGWSTNNYGVTGDSKAFPGVRGTSTDGRGVEGWSTNNAGVFGIGLSKKATGVLGTCDDGTGVQGWSVNNYGVTGESKAFPGVRGTSTNGRGVEGWSTGDDGVFGISKSNKHAGVSGHNTAGGMAGFFEGSVTVIGAFHHNGHCIHDGDVTHNGKVTHNGNVDTHGTHTVTGDVVLTNGDCAEEFNIAESVEVEPGTVMVLDQDGALQPSQQAYDKRVAGVISGAGDYKPAIVLDKQQSSEHRVPVALVGKVYCKVDACYASIEVGDLLTTSPTAGHAMKASDHLKAFGAVIGKALRPLKEGQSLIPILIALQ